MIKLCPNHKLKIEIKQRLTSVYLSLHNAKYPVESRVKYIVNQVLHGIGK